MTVQAATRRAVEILGSQKALQIAAKVSQQWVSDAFNGRIKEVSVARAFAIERATGGAVKAAEFAGIAPEPETGASGCDADAPGRSACPPGAGGRAA